MNRNFIRNDKCWCGSGRNYRSCHMGFDMKLNELKRRGYRVPNGDIIKTNHQIDGIRKSAAINNAVLDLVNVNIKEGMSTDELNCLVHDYTISQGAIPAPLNYGGFPKSICTSLNDQVCHGIPDKNVILKKGDIINVDVSTIYNGYYSDASRMYIIGEASDKANRIVQECKECLKRGIEATKPWGFVGDIGYAIQTYAESKGYSVVRDFGGHGIGNEFHEDPFVPHVGRRGTGMVLVPGMVFTIEPMINEGGYQVFVNEDDHWTVHTADGLLSAQWEHMVLVTESGVEILSK